MLYVEVDVEMIMNVVKVLNVIKKKKVVVKKLIKYFFFIESN